MIEALARDEFPALAADPGIVYLDSAATTQKPRRVIDAITAELTACTANPGRGSYPWSAQAARHIAGVRERAARFVGAAGPDEIVFTPGATAGLNAVAMSWGLMNLADGDEILFSPSTTHPTCFPGCTCKRCWRAPGGGSAWCRMRSPPPARQIPAISSRS